MIYLNGYNACCALGRDIAEIMANLYDNRSPGLRLTPDYLVSGQSVYLGHAAITEEELNALTLPTAHNSRNNRLLWHTWLPLQQRYTELCHKLKLSPERIAVIMGTSTSGGAEIDAQVTAMIQSQASQTNQASPTSQVEPTSNEFSFTQQELGDTSEFMHEALGLPPNPFHYTISTACSSTLRAIITGVRLLQANLCDLAIVGGCDSLNREVVNGFNALSLVSTERCCPFGAQRSGITIGEAAGVMLLSRDPLHAQVAIVGLGESSDAHHMSAPHPEGLGASLAINEALSQAHLKPEDIGYINLHGTGTKMNDAVEANVIFKIFGSNTPCSSTKYLTGHTLGACGILETILLAQLLTDQAQHQQQQKAPAPENMGTNTIAPAPATLATKYLASTVSAAAPTAQHNALPRLFKQDFQDQSCDPTLPKLHFCTGEERLSTPYVLNNAFAFGGNNAAIILKQITSSTC